MPEIAGIFAGDIMIVTSECKVPGGKMIKVRVHLEDEVIKNVTITGDFFIYPEEAIEHLEEELRGQRITSADFVKLVSHFLAKMKAEIAGATADDFALTLKRALNSR